MWIRYLLILLFFAVSACGEIIPPARRITWTGNVGIPGGIPTGQTIYTNLSPMGGSVNDATNIMIAMAACPSNQVILMSAGTFRIDTSIDFQNLNGVVLRGSGRASTIWRLSYDAQKAINMRGTPGTAYSSLGTASEIRTNITSSIVQGTTVITLGNATGFNIGGIYVVSHTNDVDVDSMNASEPGPSLLYGTNRSRVQTVIVTAKTGNDLTVDPPLSFTYTNAPMIHDFYQTPVRRCGIESLKIDQVFTNGDANCIGLEGAFQCWIKDVVVTNFSRSGVLVSYSTQCEVRDSDILNPTTLAGGQGYGIPCYYFSCFNLIENNVLRGCHSGISVQFGGAGNVFGYNYVINGSSDSGSEPSISSHAAHNFMNLWEGNWTMDKADADYVHGSSDRNTLFRNRIVGHQSGKTFTQHAVIFYELNRHWNIVGNILGDPSYHTTYRFDYPTAATGNPIMILGSDGNADSNGDDVTEMDAIVHGNYDTVTADVTWDAGIADHVIQDSLYLSSKPSSFGFLTWPSFSTFSSTNTLSYTNIPSGYRYANGTNPPAAAVYPSRHGRIRGWRNGVR